MNPWDLPEPKSLHPDAPLPDADALLDAPVAGGVRPLPPAKPTQSARGATRRRRLLQPGALPPPAPLPPAETLDALLSGATDSGENAVGAEENAVGAEENAVGAEENAVGAGENAVGAGENAEGPVWGALEVAAPEAAPVAARDEDLPWEEWDSAEIPESAAFSEAFPAQAPLGYLPPPDDAMPEEAVETVERPRRSPPRHPGRWALLAAATGVFLVVSLVVVAAGLWFLRPVTAAPTMLEQALSPVAEPVEPLSVQPAAVAPVEPEPTSVPADPAPAKVAPTATPVKVAAKPAPEPIPASPVAAPAAPATPSAEPPAEEKKRGRLFGRGKKAEPVATPPPPPEDENPWGAL